MKVVDIEGSDLAQCLKSAGRQDLILTRKGKPVVLMIGVKGMDVEQIQLGTSARFWERVRAWRKQKTISRSELEKRLNDA
jgi:hypothetical protein